MKISRILLSFILWASLCCFASGQSKYAALKTELENIVSDNKARIGIAVIINDVDTVGVNMNEVYPMLSVYKFPIALLLADDDLDKSIRVTASDLKRDTYSPMMKKYDDIAAAEIPIRELLAYSLQQSDNNASDIILNYVGGAAEVSEYLAGNGFSEICVMSTEDEMHADPQLCYLNTSTPLAMAALMNDFDTNADGPMAEYIKKLLITCETGKDRLGAPLKGTEAVFGHKTGTGFPLPNGGIMAFNDVGFIRLPDGTRYSIAVFIADTPDNPTVAANIIARISKAVLTSIKN